MRLRLRNFAGLRLGLAPGWYELPSHTSAGDRRRLLDLLSQGLADASTIVDCKWPELGLIEASVGADVVIHVSVPGSVDHDARARRWQSSSPRVGLYTVDAPGRWPEPNWDERVVKSALAAWLRRSFASEDHPLAQLGLGRLALDRLIASTCEPIELLELVELSVAHASALASMGEAVDWDLAAASSVARRLGRRLEAVEPGLRAPLLRTIGAAGDGQLGEAVDRHELAELARIGLAHVSEGQGLLVPLARQVSDPAVRAALEDQGMFVALPRVGDVPKRRARTPAEAVRALDPSVRIGPEDPRFVDLREHLPWVRTFAEHFVALLEPDEGFVRLAVLAQPRSGADTMIRRLLHELRASHGIVSVSVSGLRELGEHAGPAELWLAVLRSLVEWVVAEAELWLPTQLLDRLASWLVEQSPSSALADHGEGDAGPRAVDLLGELRRLEDRARASDAAELQAQTRALIWHLWRVVEEIQWQLLARGQRLCLRIEGMPHPQQFRVDRVLLAALDELHGLACNLVLSLSFAAECDEEHRSVMEQIEAFQEAEKSRPVSERVSTLVYPEGLADTEATKAARILAARSLLDARLELDAVFEDVDDSLSLLADVAHVGDMLGLARQACEAVSERRVRAEDIRGLSERRLSQLPPLAPEVVMMLGVIASGAMSSHAWRMALVDLLVPRADGGWSLHPLIQDAPELRAAEHWVRGWEGDPELRIEQLRKALDLAAHSPLKATRQHAMMHADLGQALFAAEMYDEATTHTLVAVEMGEALDDESAGVVSRQLETLRNYLPSVLLQEQPLSDEMVKAFELAYTNDEDLPESLSSMAEFTGLYISIGMGDTRAVFIRNVRDLIPRLSEAHPLRVAFEQAALTDPPE